MRIVILGKAYPPDRGGIETHLQDLARAITPHHDVRVIVHNAHSKSHDAIVDGIPITRVGTVWRPLNQPISPGMLNAVRASNPDLVHVHAPDIWATLVALRMPQSVPTVITHHADIVGREPARSVALVAYRSLARRAKRVIVTQSNNFACSKDLPDVESKLVVAPLCVDTAVYTSDASIPSEAATLRNRLFGDAPLGVFVGRLVEYKGADVMLRAMCEVPKLKIVLIGDGALRGRLTALAQQLRIAERVHFAGSVDERSKHLFLCASDFLVLPSVTIAETFGIVQVEAMLWGKPVITTSLPSGVPQVGEPDVTTLIVPPREAAPLASAMRRLVDDKDLRRQLGAAGRGRAHDLYSVEKFTQTYLDLYKAAAR